MPRHKQIRRRSELPLSPNVIAALRKMRHSLAILNALLLPSDMSVEFRLMCLGSVALEFNRDAITFVSALLCDLPQNDSLPPCITIQPEKENTNEKQD